MIGAMLKMEGCFYSLQDLPDVLWLVYNIVHACLCEKDEQLHWLSDLQLFVEQFFQMNLTGNLKWL